MSEWKEITPHRNTSKPGIFLTVYGLEFQLSMDSCKELGYPRRVKLMVKDNSVAIVPSLDEENYGYSLYHNGSKSISTRRVKVRSIWKHFRLNPPLGPVIILGNKTGENMIEFDLSELFLSYE